MKTIAAYLGTAALAGSLLMAAGPAAAQAGEQGRATVIDVSLGGFAADYFKYASLIDPQTSGPNGGTVGFASTFSPYGSGSWTRLAEFGAGADNDLPSLSSTALGLNLTMSFDKTDGQHGSWRFSNNDLANNVQLDLVFAMHGPGGSGAWLFDDQPINAGQNLSGNWEVKFVNGHSLSEYANLTLFARNSRITPFVPSAVPEPRTYLMLLAGLGLIVFMSRRRKDEHDTFA